VEYMAKQVRLPPGPLTFYLGPDLVRRACAACWEHSAPQLRRVF